MYLLTGMTLPALVDTALVTSAELKLPLARLEIGAANESLDDKMLLVMIVTRALVILLA